MVSKNTPPGCAGHKPVPLLCYELLTLGDELLLGHTANSHLTFIGQQLGRRGVTLRRNITTTDEAAVIAAQFRESWARADVVITTGGLGPTCDDRTREAVAEVLGQKLVFDEAIAAGIAAYFARSGRKMTPNNRQQAFRFEHGEVLPNAQGTAPGLWVEQDGKVLCMLPGPPTELQPLFTEQVVPKLAGLGLLLPAEAYVQIRTAGIGESALEHKLQPVFRGRGEALSVAFCAHAGQVDCRVSSPSGQLGHDQLQQIAAECALLVGEDFLCFGHDSLAQICADLLRAREASVAVAETITGGLLANAFAGLCGANKFFAGGCVCSSNEAKQQLLEVPEEIMLQHGAVSAESAVAMATGVAEKLGAHYGLAIAGSTSGSCGGVPENTHGVVYLALSAPHGVWSKKLSLPGTRSQVKPRAIAASLDWLRRELLRSQQCGCPAGNPGGAMQ